MLGCSLPPAAGLPPGQAAGCWVQPAATVRLQAAGSSAVPSSHSLAAFQSRCVCSRRADARPLPTPGSAAPPPALRAACPPCCRCRRCACSRQRSLTSCCRAALRAAWTWMTSKVGVAHCIYFVVRSARVEFNLLPSGGAVGGLDVVDLEGARATSCSELCLSCKGVAPGRGCRSLLVCQVHLSAQIHAPFAPPQPTLCTATATTPPAAPSSSSGAWGRGRMHAGPLVFQAVHAPTAAAWACKSCSCCLR